MEYMYPNDMGTSDKRADGKAPPALPQDGKAYKLIKLNYDIVIIVDDSTSMTAGKPISRWQECSEAISVIAEAALDFDSGGIDVHFLNSPHTRTCKTGAEVRALFQAVHPNAGTPTGAKLEQLLKSYWGELKESRRLFGAPVNPPKPVVFIVLTDGEPTDNPKSVILKYAKKLQRARWPQHQVGIQFVQVGDSREAARSLKEMDDDLKQKAKRDIVDYTLYDPAAMSGSSADEHTIQAQLTKILVGAIDEDVDRRTAGNIYEKRQGASQSTVPPPSYQRATSSRLLY